MLSHRIETFALGAALALAAPACGPSPEETLIGCWTETEWVYERADEDVVARHFWNDGVRPRRFPARPLIEHVAERWRFSPRGEMHIALLDGTVQSARWRLKGRGHVLAIRHGDHQFEVYDIKRIDEHALTLHFDMGVEARGIARLEFTRSACGGSGEAKVITADGLADDGSEVARS